MGLDYIRGKLKFKTQRHKGQTLLEGLSELMPNHWNKTKIQNIIKTIKILDIGIIPNDCTLSSNENIDIKLCITLRIHLSVLHVGAFFWHALNHLTTPLHLIMFYPMQLNCHVVGRKLHQHNEKSNKVTNILWWGAVSTCDAFGIIKLSDIYSTWLMLGKNVVSV